MENALARSVGPEPPASAKVPPPFPETEMTQTEASSADSSGEAREAPAAAREERRPVVRTEAKTSRLSGARFLVPFAGLITLVSLFGLLSASGIWDPYELRVADLSRRIALNLLGAKALALEGGVNSVPTLGELARGQLPFTSVALGFRLFGLHEWAGRLPLALWGLLGALSTYALVSRLVDRVAAAFSVLALVTMPLYFLHARTMLGDIVTMAAMALAVAGLGIAAFDSESSTKKRLLAIALAFVGLGAGFVSRGALVGVAVPALGVGMAWLLMRQFSGASNDPLRLGVGLGALGVGLVALGLGVRALLRAPSDPTQFSLLLGSAVVTVRQLPTFEEVIHQLGHALFPWSAVIPFAVGRLFRPPHGVSGQKAERETALRVTLLMTSALAFGAYTLLSPTVGVLPFGAVFALAAICGVGLRDFERGAPGSRVLAMGVAALAVLFYYDFKNFPEKGLSAFVVDDARFPDSFKQPGDRFLKIGTLGFIAIFFASFMEQTKPDADRFKKDEYTRWPKTLRTLWTGNLWFLFLVAEAALAGYAFSHLPQQLALPLETVSNARSAPAGRRAGGLDRAARRRVDRSGRARSCFGTWRVGFSRGLR